MAAYRSQPESELLFVIGGMTWIDPTPADPAAMRHANHATTAPSHDSGVSICPAESPIEMLLLVVLCRG